MAKTIFEQMGGTYTQVGDYFLPNLKLPEEEKQANIGVWGMRHKRFLKENHRVLYANLMTSGKLVAYLDDIEQQATAMFLRLVKELTEKENVTEEVKAFIVYRKPLAGRVVQKRLLPMRKNETPSVIVEMRSGNCKLQNKGRSLKNE